MMKSPPRAPAAARHAGGFYIALAALAACIVMVLGLMTQVTTQADIGQQPATAHVQSEAGRHG
ncbi:hypothetical protein Q1M64_28740 [Sinorhizobium meliloti]|nr:hypothetical protein Q1M64_28740 [Sinorhizobium meliloti]